MSLDYNFSASSLLSAFDKGTMTELSAQLKPGAVKQAQSSFSSASSTSTSTTHGQCMATEFASESEMESKLLPQNLWGDSATHRAPSASSVSANTAEEERFLQSQLSSADLWYSQDFSQAQHQTSSSAPQHHDALSSSTSSVFDLKAPTQQPFSTQHQHTQQHQQQISTPTSSCNTPTPMPQFNPLMGIHLSSPMGGATPQMTPLASQQMTPQQNLQHFAQPLPQLLPQMNAAQLLSNTQSMLQSYQQQQLYLEQLQQQQAQLLQNPLFFQQQTQLVSQQLQQLQLQLQIQQQQIESLNAKKLEADKLPLTQENLTKLQQSPSDKKTTSSTDAPDPAPQNNITADKSSHSSDNKSTVNTDLYKTELCTTFQKNGTCPYGNKCQFAHGSNELKVVERGSKWRSKPCANWTKTGSCRYGNRCCFKHE